MNTQIKLSTVQKAIQRIIEDFIINEDKILEHNKDNSVRNYLLYCFHDSKSISVDGDFYDILLYGCADYNYGSSLYTDIHNMLDISGYYLEYEGQGIYNIVKS